MANVSADSGITSIACCHKNVKNIDVKFRLLFLVFLFFFPLLVRADGAICFGIQGAATKATLESIWKPLLADMAETIGRPVEAALFEDYATTVSSIKKGEVQLAWLGNKNAIEAVDHADAEIFAQIVGTRGIPGYYSLLITHRDSPYENFGDVIADKQNVLFGLGDRHSTSGTTVPLYFLFAQNNISQYDLGSFRHANHEANYLEVADKTVDVATISSVMLQRFKERHPTKAELIRVIWASPLIPSDPLIWSRSLDPSLKPAIRNFFFAYGKPDGKKTYQQVEQERQRLAKSRWSGFKPSNNKQLDYVRILYLFGELETVKVNQNMDENTKQQRITELEDRIRAMEAGQR